MILTMVNIAISNFSMGQPLIVYLSRTKNTKAVEITPAQKRIRYNMEFKSLKDKNKFIKNLTEIKQQLKIK